MLFHQKADFTFQGFADLRAPLPPYLDPEYLGILAVSQDNQAYLECAFPGVRVHRLHLALNFQLLTSVPPERKQRCIAFMTRRNPADRRLGDGCREDFTQERCRVVESGDVIGFIRAVEEEIDRFERGCLALQGQISEAARHVGQE